MPDHPNFISEYRLYVDESREDMIAALNGLKTQIEAGELQDWAFPNLQATYFKQHLYQPLLSFRSNFVDVSPVSLNEGEIEFVTDLRSFCDANPLFFEDKELYLLRNMSRGRGIGFFEAGNFYPDFLLWLLVEDKQYITFVDPKGIRNLEGPDDPKIRFFRTVKALESQLGDPAIVLNSFIVVNTPFKQVRWWTDDLSKESFTKSHVLFQQDDRATYIKQMLTMIVGDQPAKESTG